MATALMEPGFDMDRLSSEIFSILEHKYLFGDESPVPSLSLSTPPTPIKWTIPEHLHSSGKVRILSIDGGDSLLAATALTRLETLLQMQSGDTSTRIADFFDIAAGSGTGGVLAAMLFTRGFDGMPLFTAEDALHYLTTNQGKHSKGFLRRVLRRSCGNKLGRVFGDATMKDTLKPLLIPCYDLSTAAPFMFSRSDAVETDSYDFTMVDVCAATMGQGRVAEVVKSLDGRTVVSAVGGSLAMQNPTAAAITHVLNNKQEFPFASSMEDVIVLSLGRPQSMSKLVHIAGEEAADMVDQSVAMAFGESKSTNYVRIQGNGFGSRSVEEVMGERNVESVMFRGKRVSEKSNGEKLETFSRELVKEEDRRRRSSMVSVMIKEVMSPRSSSVTTSTVMTATTLSSRASTSP